MAQGGELSARSSPIEPATTESGGDQCSWKYQVSPILIYWCMWWWLIQLLCMSAGVNVPFQARFYHWKEYWWSHGSRWRLWKGDKILQIFWNICKNISQWQVLCDLVLRINTTLHWWPTTSPLKQSHLSLETLSKESDQSTTSRWAVSMFNASLGQNDFFP